MKVALAAQAEANKQRAGLSPKSIKGSLERKAGFMDGAVWYASQCDCPHNCVVEGSL